MMFDIWITVLGYVFEGIAGLLPEGAPLGIGAAMSSGVSLAMGFDASLPIHELVALLGVVVGAEALILAYGVVKTVYAWIPIVS